MAKVDVELVKIIMQRNELDIRTIARILEDIHTELANQVDEDKPPPVKKEYSILVSDPEGILKNKDLVGWVLQIPEGDSPLLAEERLLKSAYAFNQTPKGQRMPVKSIGEVCEHVSARIAKEEQVWIKTKEPVLITCTGNKVPWENKE